VLIPWPAHTFKINLTNTNESWRTCENDHNVHTVMWLPKIRTLSNTLRLLPFHSQMMPLLPVSARFSHDFQQWMHSKCLLSLLMTATFNVSCIIAKADYSKSIFGSKHDINVASKYFTEKHNISSSSLSSSPAYHKTYLLYRFKHIQNLCAAKPVAYTDIRQVCKKSTEHL